MPMLGPVSPSGELPEYVEGEWVGEPPADGFYGVSISRVSDPPGVLLMEISRLVECSHLPDRCPPNPPSDGIVADPDSSVTAAVIMTDHRFAVVLRPIQDRALAPASGLPYAFRGDGMAFYELLSSGVDHAHIEWIHDPLRSGETIEVVEARIVEMQSDPGFPLGEFRPQGETCRPESWCPFMYRGPYGMQLVMWVGLGEGDRWPGYELYGWDTALRIEGGRFILHIDAGQFAG